MAMMFDERSGCVSLARELFSPCDVENPPGLFTLRDVSVFTELFSPCDAGTVFQFDMEWSSLRFHGAFQPMRPEQPVPGYSEAKHVSLSKGAFQPMRLVRLRLTAQNPVVSLSRELFSPGYGEQGLANIL